MKKILSILFVFLLFVSVVSCVSKLSNSSESDSLFSGVTEFIESFISSDQKTDGYTETNTESPSIDVDISDLNYAAFGDSITFGADWSKNSANDGSQMSNPYPQLVGDNLGLASVQNFGVGSSTYCSNDYPNLTCSTDIILAYMGDADIISVMLGVNDWGYSLPLGSISDSDTSTVYGSLNLIATHLTTNHKDAFVFFMTPYKTALTIDTAYPLSDLANAVKEVAAMYDIPVLDMYSVGRFELEMYDANSDGVHPSQEFFEEYTAPQIAEFIRQNYRGK